MTEGTAARGTVTEATDAEGARGAGGSTMAGATDAVGVTETTDARAAGGGTMACGNADAL